VERAAEEAGLNGGEGFIPNRFETTTVPGVGQVPILSPQLLYLATKEPFRLGSIASLIAGTFDPVDFILTDPLGRRLGYTASTGRLNDIPDAIYDGDGPFENFVILSPVPGSYTLNLVGLGQTASGFVGGMGAGGYINEPLAPGETRTITFAAPTVVYPTAYEVVRGEELAGSLASLRTPDGDSLDLFNDAFTLDGLVEATCAVTGSPSTLRVEAALASARPGTAQALKAFKYSAGSWTSLDARTSAASFVPISSTIPNPADHIGSGGAVKLRASWEPINDEDPAQDGWLYSIDYINWLTS
jgi:hypothetical protein